MKKWLSADDDRMQKCYGNALRCISLFVIGRLWFISLLFLPFALSLYAEGSGSDGVGAFYGAYDKAVGAVVMPPPQFNWIYLPPGQVNGSCLSGTDCCADIICYGLEYTPGVTGEVTSYTTGFFVDCLTGLSPLVYNESCTMEDNSFAINGCMDADSVLFNSSAYDGALPVTAGVAVILHQVCFAISPGQSITIDKDEVTDLTLSIDLTGGGQIDEFPAYSTTTISWPVQSWPADQATTIACVDAAIEPAVPVVFDLCGNQINAALISTLNVPAVITCEGFRVYVFQYTDCSGNTHILELLLLYRVSSFHRSPRRWIDRGMS